MAACRCLNLRLPGAHEVGCPQNTRKCVGCGHPLGKHRHYIRGERNRHGSTLVCSVDNCGGWTECRDTARTVEIEG